MQHAHYNWKSTIVPLQFVAELTTVKIYLDWVTTGVVSLLLH